MYTRRNIRWSIIFSFAWRQVLVFLAWSAMVVFAFTWLEEYGVNCSVPIAPLGTIGVAVAFYIGFKNNQSYDRSWEARKIWGGIVNASRSWGNQVLTYVTASRADHPVEPSEIRDAQHTLIYRHLAWIHTLRFQLRRKTVFGFKPKGSARKYMQETDLAAMREQIAALLPEEELSVACSQVNAAAQILRQQGEHLRRANDEEHLIEEFRLISMMDSLSELYALQGKCERP